MRVKSRLAIAAMGIAAGLMAQRALTTQPAKSPPRAGQATRPVSLPAKGEYVDPSLCATCHGDISQKFRQTGMGRSFHPPLAGDIVDPPTIAKPAYNEASGSYFAMIERGGKYYQRRWEKGSTGGADTNVDEKRVDFVMGSGNHSRTFLHLTNTHTLQELPLGWYSEKGGYWAMSPGFDRPDYPGSTRTITYECMLCHNAYPRIPKGHAEAGARQEFLQPMPEGIDCQRCHGPGRRHVDAASRPGAKPEDIRAAIVNPKRLSPERELEVCLQCHLETTSAALPHAIRRLDREPFSYRPGQPLGDFHLAFEPAGGMGERFEIAHEAYRMLKSRCYLESAGKLRCTTCHDPHDIPRGETATAHYNGICRDCHAAAFQRSVSTGTHPSATDCVSCHMPKRRPDDAVHVVMTDHFIRARTPPGDLVADKPGKTEWSAAPYRGPVVPYYPAAPGGATEEQALYSALAQVREGSNLESGIPLLASLIVSR